MKNLDKALRAVVRGPQAKGLKVRGHHWNFKKAVRENVDRAAGTGVIRGTISHAVRFVDDDQVKYEITFTGRRQDGGLRKPQIEIKIKTARWGGIAATASGVVVTALTKGNALAGKATSAAASEVFKRLHGDWRSTAEGLVAVIAVHFAEQLMQPKRPASRTVRVRDRRRRASAGG